MAIWKRETDLDALNAIGENSLVAHIGIRFTAIGDDYLEAVMPVDVRTHQPFGIEVNASHHRSVSSGEVRGICRPLHIGSRNQVWQIEIRNARGQLCCSSRLTVAVLG